MVRNAAGRPRGRARISRWPITSATIPGMASLDDVPSGTPVLVRGDVDAKPGAKIGDGDIRLRSMVDTLEFGRDRGWKQIIFGHIGRKPEGSLAKVAKRLGELLKCDVPLISDWLDESRRHDSAGRGRSKSPTAKPGAVLMLENTRKYDIETRALEGQAGRPAEARAEAREAGQRVRREAWPSLTSSKRSRPAASMRAASSCRRRWSASRWASTCRHEFTGPMMRCLDCAAGDLQRPEDRQARRPGSDDRPRQNHARDRRRLAGDGACARRPPSSTARDSASASPKIRRTTTSRTTSRRSASSRRSE